MKYNNFFYGALAAILINFVLTHGMEQKLESQQDKTILLQTQIMLLKNDKVTYKKYEPIITEIESLLPLSANNKIEIIRCTLYMIDGVNIHTVLDAIDKQITGLDNKIHILSNLYHLPQPCLYQDSTISTRTALKNSLTVTKEKDELAYWLNGKAKIKEIMDLAIKKYDYENQKSSINNKICTNKKISLEKWKTYQLSLLEYNKVIKDIPTKQNIKQIIQDTKEIIAIEEIELELKSMVSHIRQSKTADIDELCEYKKTLEKYITILSEPFPEKPVYLETVKNVSNRIKLLNEIDDLLSISYDFLTIKELEGMIEHLQNLQIRLNKPQSERHTQLTDKIEQIGWLTKNGYQQL